jgi:hypothetical protein
MSNVTTIETQSSIISTKYCYEDHNDTIIKIGNDNRYKICIPTRIERITEFIEKILPFIEQQFNYQVILFISGHTYDQYITYYIFE